MAGDCRDAGSPKRQTLQDLDISPSSCPKRTKGKPASMVNGSEIIDKPQYSDAGNRLPAFGRRRVVLAREPILRRRTSSSDLWPPLASEAINPIAIGEPRKKSDGQNDRTC